MFRKLQYISQGKTHREQIYNIKSVLDAGCNWVQLRFKNADELTLIKTALSIKKISSSYDFTFIINDHTLVAKEVEADGVHLGLEDLEISSARNIIGNNKIIGGTANTIQQVNKRINDGVNYIGLGPYRFTKNKEKLSPLLGLKGCQEILKSLNEDKKKIPIYAIGGLTLEDLPDLMSTGIYGIAVSGLITHEINKKIIIQDLKEILNGQFNYSRETI